MVEYKILRRRCDPKKVKEDEPFELERCTIRETHLIQEGGKKNQRRIGKKSLVKGSLEGSVGEIRD